jgi:hypothetical protein
VFFLSFFFSKTLIISNFISHTAALFLGPSSLSKFVMPDASMGTQTVTNHSSHTGAHTGDSGSDIDSLFDRRPLEMDQKDQPRVRARMLREKLVMSVGTQARDHIIRFSYPFSQRKNLVERSFPARITRMLKYYNGTTRNYPSTIVGASRPNIQLFQLVPSPNSL